MYSLVSQFNINVLYQNVAFFTVLHCTYRYTHRDGQLEQGVHLSVKQQTNTQNENTSAPYFQYFGCLGLEFGSLGPLWLNRAPGPDTDAPPSRPHN